MSMSSSHTGFSDPARRISLFSRGRRALFVTLLERIAAGRLKVTFPDGATMLFGNLAAVPRAELSLRSWRAIDRLLLRGDIGFAEAYAAGECETSDLAALFDLVVANEEVLKSRLSGSFAGRIANRLRHLLNSNTRRGSRANISFHYDLGNDFYAAWLDPTMTYSAARYEQVDQSLESAQIAKYRQICRALGTKPGDRILEIGCGWGGFAEIAAGEFGVVVHGVTLSTEQLVFAKRRIARAGLGDRATFSLTDYRDLSGQYDYVVSIEMFEAVGQAYWPSFFDRLRARLKPGGKVFLQVITIENEQFNSYAARPDFIQRFIFPGGMLPSPGHLDRLIADAGFDRVETQYAASDYERTLIVWREAFAAAWPRIASLGFDERFKRLWTYYLHYCEAGFRHGAIDLGRFVLARAA